MFPTPQETAMTRNLITKLVVVALAIASLGLASTASAAEPQNGAAPVDPVAPAQPAQPAQPDQGVQAGAEQQAPDQAVDQVKKSKEDELFERFQKECPNGEFSPGQFCKDFARGKFNTKPPTSQERERFKRFCNMKDAEPSHSDKAFCQMYRNGDFGCDEFVTAPKCKGKGGSTSSTGNGGKGDGYDNGDYDSPVKKAEKVLNKQLPFTGLEIWQLGLLGAVLSGGGLGVRRLLAS
jgi:hypothetical protein